LTLLFYACSRYFYKLQSHTMSDTIDRDNMSTLLLAIISPKHVTAYRL